MVVCQLFVSHNHDTKSTTIRFEGSEYRNIRMRFISQLFNSLNMRLDKGDSVVINRIVPLGEVQSYVDEFFNSDIVEVYQDQN